MKQKQFWAVISAVIYIWLQPVTVPPVLCAEPETAARGAGSAAVIDQLEQQGVISGAEADELRRRSRKGDRPETAGAKPSIAVRETLSQGEMDKLTREVTERVKQDMKEEIKREIKDESAVSDQTWLERVHASVPEWTRRIRLNGDARLRYEGNFFDQNNADFLKPDDPTELANTKNDRNRFRYRARLGLTAEINTQVEAGLRLATGTSDNPVSTNETAGDFFNKDYFLLDQAYLKIRPIPRAPQTALWGGKFPNPWLATEMVWDGDVVFEGLAVRYDDYVLDWLRPILTVGWFPLQEEEWYSDKYLAGAQAAVEFKPKTDLAITLGAACYDYRNVRGEANDILRPGELDWTAPQYMQKGNSLMDIDPEPGGITTALAGDYRIIDAVAILHAAVFQPVHVNLTGNYAENVGFDADEVARRLGEEEWPDETTAYQVALWVGHPRVRNFSEWNVSFAYRYVEADAVLDAFTDSDFHLGGTNAKGWLLKTDWGLTKNLWLTIGYSTADEIIGDPLAIDVLQIDLNASF
ncbi:MAG: putative porin [Thermodesulfobacteriota bacterium]